MYNNSDKTGEVCEDPLETLDKLRGELRDLGATGMSFFLRNTSEVSLREYAQELSSHIALIKKECMHTA